MNTPGGMLWSYLTPEEIPMCHRTTCRTCNKSTWAGCGNHIEQALAGVPKSERCTCTPAQKASQPSGGFMSRFFG